MNEEVKHEEVMHEEGEDGEGKMGRGQKESHCIDWSLDSTEALH